MSRLRLLAPILSALTIFPLELRGQEPSTVASLDSLLRDSLITDSVVLRKIIRNNVAFIPTPTHVDSLLTQRPWLRDTLTRALAAACVQGNPKLSVSISEVAFLVERNSARCPDDEALIEYLSACPQGGTYQGLRSIARAEASRRLLAYLATLCRVRIDRPKWEFSGQVERSVLSAAEAIRTEQMQFSDATGVSARLSFSPQRFYRVALALGFGQHNLDASGIDLRPAGRFSLWSLSGSTRVLVSCLWNGGKCGDPLLTKGDAYAEVSASIDHLAGNMRLTASPSYLASVGITSLGPFGISFGGWGLGGAAGYRWRLTRALALEAESRYTAIRLDRVTVRASGFSPMKGDVSGWSKRFSIGLSAVVLVRL